MEPSCYKLEENLWFMNFQKKKHISEKKLFEKCPLVVNLNKLEFKNFEVNKVYKKSISLLNCDKQLAYFNIDNIRNDSEFSYNIKSAKPFIASGLKINIDVIFKPKECCDKREILKIRTKNETYLEVVLLATQIPPKLKFFGKKLRFVNDGIIDVGGYLVGTDYMIDICMKHTGNQSRYFIIPEKLWSLQSFDIFKSPKSSTENLSQMSDNTGDFEDNEGFYKSCLDSFSKPNIPFNFQPQYFKVQNNDTIIGTYNLKVKKCGVISEKFIILCDNGSKKYITIRGKGIKISKRDFLFQNVFDKDLPIADDEDPTCEYICDLGSILTEQSVEKKFKIKNNCNAENKIDFHWKIEKPIVSNDISIAVDIYPPAGEFQKEETVEFKLVCMIPLEITGDLRFIARLFCKADIQAICFNSFDTPLIWKRNVFEFDNTIREIEKQSPLPTTNDECDLLPLMSSEPSIIFESLQSIEARENVCVGSIEFILDCNREISVHLNPWFMNLMSLSLNREVFTIVEIQNECSHCLSCNFVIDECISKNIKITFKPKQFILKPFGKREVKVCILPLKSEPFEFDILCRIKEDLTYKPKLKIQGTVTNDCPKFKKNILNCGVVALGASIEIPLDLNSKENHKNKYKVDLPNKSDNKLEIKLLDIHRILSQIKYTENLIEPLDCIRKKKCVDSDRISKVLNDLIDRGDSVSAITMTTYIDSCKSGCESNSTSLTTLTKSENTVIEKNIKVVFRTNGYGNNIAMNIKGLLPRLEYFLLEIKSDLCLNHKLIICKFISPNVSIVPSVLHCDVKLNEPLDCKVLLKSSECFLKYKWSTAGIDRNKTGIDFHKPCGRLKSYETEMLFTVLPLKRDIEEFHLFCFLERLETPIVLKLKLHFKDIEVKISWFSYENIPIKYLWPNNNLTVEKFTWCGLDIFQTVFKRPCDSYSITGFSRDYLFGEIVPLPETDTKSNSVVSIEDLNYLKRLMEDKSSLSKDNSLDNENPSLKTVENSIKECSNGKEADMKDSSAQFELPFSYLYPEYMNFVKEFLHFENVPHKTPTKQILTVVNTSNVRCTFTISPSYYKAKVVKHDVYYVPNIRMESKWDALVDWTKNLVLYFDKTTHTLAPNSAVDIYIWVYSATWGLYMDTILIEFDSIETFHIPVSISVSKPVITFKAKHHEIPLYKFYLKDPMMDNHFSVPFENVCGIPVKIFWRCCENDKEKEAPFTVPLDIMNSLCGEDIIKFIPDYAKSKHFFVKTIIMPVDKNSKNVLRIYFNHNVTTPPGNIGNFIGNIVGFVWPNLSYVENIGVYREPVQVEFFLEAKFYFLELNFLPVNLNFKFKLFELFEISDGIQSYRSIEFENPSKKFVTKCKVLLTDPFKIVSIVKINNAQITEVNEEFLIKPKDNVMLTLKCVLTKYFVHYLQLKPNFNNLLKKIQNNILTLKYPIEFLYNEDLSVKKFESTINLIMPVLKLSRHVINFSKVFIGDMVRSTINIEVINGNAKDINFSPDPNDFQENSPIQYFVNLNEDCETKLSLEFQFRPIEIGIYEKLINLNIYIIKHEVIKIRGDGTNDCTYKSNKK